MHTLVNATQLKHWADTRNAQGTLPFLVRNLILGTVNGSAIQRMSFPAGDSIFRPGVDGGLQVAHGTAFVPTGHSVWEMGVDQNPKKKANRDYNTRTANPGDVTPSNTCFVFVTPRRWPGKETWAQEKKAEGVWADVRTLDGDGLEGWLETCPPVAAWACRTIGGLPEGLTDLQRVWEEWQHRTTPNMKPGLLLAGRKQFQDIVHNWLEGPASCLRVRGDSFEEAIGFLAAAIQQEGDLERTRVLSRGVLVSTSEAWRSLAEQQTPVILVSNARISASDALAVRRGHHVYLAYGKEDSGVTVDVDLPPLRRKDLESALQDMGVAREGAEILANDSRGQIAVLIDMLGGSVRTPKWAGTTVASDLTPLLLAGSWTDSAADHEALRKLCRADNGEVSRRVARWTNEPDSPIRRVGNVWEWISRRRAWPHLSRFISDADVSAFRDVIEQVLGEIDPRLELSSDQRWMASVHGRLPRYSEKLREGFVGGLAILAIQPSHSSGVDFQSHVNAAVRSVFGPSPDPRRWYSLAPVLPDLAEASPDVFLDAVERDVVKDESVRRQLFEEEGIFGGGGRQCHLLWALERLAWNPTYLSRAAGILASLADYSEENRRGNRPEGSLRTIFLPWLPGTRASSSQRLQAIDAVARCYQEVAFELCLDLMPQTSDFAIPSNKPRWRAWADGGGIRVSPPEYREAVHALFDRLLLWAAQNPTRLAKLVDQCPRVAHEKIDSLVSATEQVDGATWDASAVDGIRRAVRHLLHENRADAGQHAYLRVDHLARLDRLYERLEPTDPASRFAWLFSERPSLPNFSGDGWRAEDEAISAARLDALRQSFATGGADAVMKLAEAADRPGTIGRHVVDLGLSDNAVAGLLVQCLNASDKRLEETARAIMWGCYREGGWPWVDRVFSLERLTSLAAPLIAVCADGLPFETPTWNWVEAKGQAFACDYWTRARVTPVTTPSRDALRAINALIQFKRPFSALRLTAMCLHGHDRIDVPSAVLLRVLEAVTGAVAGEISTIEARDVGRDVGVDVGELLDTIGAPDSSTAMQLIRIEWVWFPILKNTRRGAAHLYEALAGTPAFFVELLKATYRPRSEGGASEELAPPDTQRTLRAEQAWHVLQEWEGVPGLPDGTNIDSAALTTWVDDVRRQCAESGYQEIGDHQIGEVLARSPPGTDRIWPHEAIRAIIDNLASADLEEGVHIGVMSSRGITSRALDTGGEPERDLADQYGQWAKALEVSHPRTARVVRGIHLEYLSMARYEDQRRDLDEFS